MVLCVLASVAASAGVPEALPGAPAFDPALRARLAQALDARPDEAPRTRQRTPEGGPRFTNRLVLETSPYLLQHAHNPVDWFPWGEEAFARARELGRPVLVSIGYSTCHWCHVMEEESFDDIETARLLNQHFVAVKVDREARPDVDALYLQAVQAMGQSGGWPLNVFVTPDRKPFFGGTYFPPKDRPGRASFRRVLRGLVELWSRDPEQVARQADGLAKALARVLEGSPALASHAPSDRWLAGRVAAHRLAFDPVNGGVQGRQKFPASLPVRLLLRLHRRGGDPEALRMATRTLEAIGRGGLHDPVGGGFHRYATDAAWRVPHFEKMLYDNALLVVAFVEAWQQTGREEFARVARQTLAYLDRELSAPDGSFVSATDADSRGPDGEVGEGFYFTWTRAELDAAVGPEDAAWAARWFDVEGEGELDGRHVLRQARDPVVFARERGWSQDELAARLASVRGRLAETRAQRPPPLRDDKSVVAWNGLTLSAFARAALAFDEPSYAKRAARAAEAALASRDGAGRLRRVGRGGRHEGPAFLEDYAFLVAGLLDLYEAAPAPRWISEARALQAVLDAHYRDADGGGYYRGADDGERLLAREKPVRDAALPSGNAVAALNLLRLAALTGETRYRDEAFRVFSAFHEVLRSEPLQASELALALDYALDTSKEVLLVAPAGGDADRLLDVVRRSFVPNRVLAVVREGEQLDAHTQVVPLLRHKKARQGEATAYVCENRTCRFPTSDPEELGKQLARFRPLAPSGEGAEAD